MYLCFGFLAFVLYMLLRPCFGECRRAAPPRIPRSRPSSNFSWFSGGHDDDRRPPPPYSKYPSSTDNAAGSTGTSQVRDGQDRLGFWSGAALGGLGTYLFNRQYNREPQPRPYDWENERYFPRQRPVYQAQRPSGASSRHQASSSQRDSRGEGSSSLGPMTTSTGYGGSTVR
jgi:SOCE-associated regulatory factor of calcium homoeostasis